MSTGERSLPRPRADLVHYVILSMPDLVSLTDVVAPLTDLVAANMVRIIDLAVLVRDVDGAVDVLELEAVASIAELWDIDGEVGGLLSEHDLELASLAIRPGNTGVVLVTEDRWEQPLAEAIARAGGQIAAGERIPPSRVEAALADRPDYQPSPDRRGG